MVRDARRDDLSGLEVGDLHSPEVSRIVYGVAARAVDRVRSEDARIRPDPRYRIAARIDQIQVTAASVVGLRFLENRPGKRVLSVVRSIGEVHLSNNVARIGIDDIDVVGRTAFPGWNVKQLSRRIDRQPIDTGADRSIPEYRVIVNAQAVDHPGA